MPDNVALRQLIDRFQWFFVAFKRQFRQETPEGSRESFLWEHLGIFVYNLVFWSPVSEFAVVLPQCCMCQTELVCDSEPQIASMLHLWYVSGVGFCHLFGTDAGWYVNPVLRASYGAQCAYAFSLLTQSCYKRSQTTSKDWVCPLVWIDGSMGVETWTKQPPFEELKGAKLVFCHFLFHYLGFSKCVFKTAFKPVQPSRYDRASARSLPRVKCHVAKLMRMLGLKARNVTLKWNLTLLLVSCG